MLKEELYLPDVIFDSILEVTPEFLREHGIKGVLCDTDNTLAYDNRKDIIPEAAEWVKRMKEAGIKICIMSNSYRVRNMPVVRALDIKYYKTRSHKPHQWYYEPLTKKMGLKHGEVAFLGDQMKTDMVGANRADILSLYVMPYAFETNPIYKNIFKKRRAKERKYIKMYNELHGTKHDFPDCIKAEMYEEDIKECVY
ncbi:MAG: YqeG family HAD IIIA-type phosphatase [Clostridia bacterium]|nr:YqeG family HAD IIIA-type phosphatase [Clostridia bacterium]